MESSVKTNILQNDTQGLSLGQILWNKGKHEGKRPVGWFICRGEANIKMDPKEVGCGGVD
jgi:hypothetical protein